MLYPKEDARDAANKQLLFACRNCDHEEKANNNKIYTNELSMKQSEKLKIYKHLTFDPTLPRTKEADCPVCRHTEAVFLSHISNQPDEAFTLIFVCCNPDCQHSWEQGKGAMPSLPRVAVPAPSAGGGH